MGGGGWLEDTRGTGGRPGREGVVQRRAGERPGDPRFSRWAPDGPFVCFLVGSFFKGNSGRLQAPGVEKARRKRDSLGGGVARRGECAGCCRKGHLTTGVWTVRPTFTPAGRGDHGPLTDLVSRLLEGCFR